MSACATHRALTRAGTAASAALLAISAGLAPPPAPPANAGRAASGAGSAPGPVMVPAYRQADPIAIITIHGPIDGVTLRSLERRIREATEAGANAIVFDIDTPGGELTATLDICNLIKDHSITPANTVAWVHPKAYSAGAIIALACREIVVAPNAAFGDAAPISPLMPLPQTERAKQESPILSEVVDSARRNHYDENLVQSFISVGVELWLIEHRTTGERVFVTRVEYRTVFGDEPPDQLSPVAPSGPDAAAQPVHPLINELLGMTPEGAASPLTAEEQAKKIEFEQMLPPVRQPLTAADRGDWRLVTQIVTDDRLLTVKPAEAIHFGLAKKVVANEEQLQQFFGASRTSRYDRSWSEAMVRFLISFPVRAVLIVIFLICLFVELAMPGVGVFGAAALVALLLLIGAPFLAGMAQWWDILLVVLGIALVAIELFVIPGFGVIGVAGAACLLVGMVGTFVSGDLSTQQDQEQLWKGALTTLLSFFAAGVAIWFISRQFHSIPMLNRVILNADLGTSSRALAGSGGSLLEAMARDTGKALAPGDEGVAQTDLRPAGRALFNERIIDVKSAGEFIEKGTRVRVVSVGRFVIEVEGADS
jgi:membrane-bound ClpP family serine protease